MNEKYCFGNAANGGKGNIMKKRAVKKGALTCSMLLASSILSGCVAVYGPPPDREPTEPPVHTEDNLPAPVYGPPEDFEIDFDPEGNIPEDVYGPPSFFGEDEAPAPEETEAQP